MKIGVCGVLLGLAGAAFGGIERADVVVIGGHAFAWERDGAPAIPDYNVYNFRTKRTDLAQGAAGVSEGERNRCLRELVLARALYRLGDVKGRAKSVLEAYRQDPRRAYAEHARLILR